MIFHFRAEVPDSADGHCDDADRRVADLLAQAVSHLINGNHPGRVEAPDASADFGYTYSKGDQTVFGGELASQERRTRRLALLEVRRCDHGYVICAPCGFIPESWRPDR